MSTMADTMRCTIDSPLDVGCSAPKCFREVLAMNSRLDGAS
jgi:hypothetical protein